MSVTVYKHPNFQGVFAQLGPGSYSGRDIVGCPHRSNHCEDMDNEISSIRVDPNVVVAIMDSHAITASGGSRVLMGPAEISNLTTLGLNDRISSILVVPFRAYDSAIPAPDAGVTIHTGYGATGQFSYLRRGDYNPARLNSEEVKLPGKRVQSIQVESGVVVVLYKGTNFETTKDAVIVVGPTLIEDIQSLGMDRKVRSIRVMYGDPFDVPNRPTLALGGSRTYTPGGSLGMEIPLHLGAGASDLLFPVGGAPSAPSNWAGMRYRPLPAPVAAPVAAPAVVTPAIAPPVASNGVSWKVFAIVLLFILVVMMAFIGALVQKKRAPHPGRTEV